MFVVNSVSKPPTDWDTREEPPHALNILLKSAGVPIDHFSYESIERLRDTAARWKSIRSLRSVAAAAAAKDPALAAALRAPDAEIYAIDVSFAALADPAEFDYLNRQPTSFVLPDEAVDRLRAAAGTIIMASPVFQRLLKDAGLRVRSDAPAALPASGTVP